MNVQIRYHKNVQTIKNFKKKKIQILNVLLIIRATLIQRLTQTQQQTQPIHRRIQQMTQIQQQHHHQPRSPLHHKDVDPSLWENVTVHLPGALVAHDVLFEFPNPR